MRFLQELWAPILVSAGASLLLAVMLRMMLSIRRGEWKRLPQQEEVLEALRRVPLAPGLYMLPHTVGQDLGRPDMRAALEQGPVGYLTIDRNGVPNTAGRLLAALVFFLVVNTIVAYAAWHGFTTFGGGVRHLPLGIPFSHVARVVFAMSGLAYAAGLVPECIWHGRPWSSAVRGCVDAAIYAGASAIIFGWLWPI